MLGKPDENSKNNEKNNEEENDGRPHIPNVWPIPTEPNRGPIPGAPLDIPVREPGKRPKIHAKELY